MRVAKTNVKTRDERMLYSYQFHCQIFKSDFQKQVDHTKARLFDQRLSACRPYLLIINRHTRKYHILPILLSAIFTKCQNRRTNIYYIILYCILFCYILLYSILLYSTPFYSTLLYSYSTLLYSTLLYYNLLYSTLFY